MTKFDQLGLKEEILRGIAELGYEDAFPIQEAVIPVLATGRDVVGQAHTGSGKTAAFALSMLQQIRPKEGIQGLILAPTRELAMQITGEIKKFSRYLDVRVATIYGGQGMGVQLDALDAGVDIIVATPGRLIDHLKRGSIELQDVTHIVLDEADTMLDMGFIDDIQFILDLAPEERVMSLFSATMPTEILRLSEEYLNNPKQFLLDADDLSGEGIDQSFLVIKDRDKSKYLIDFIKTIKGQCIVFCSTKYRTRDVAKFLHQEKFDAVAIEGDMSQHRREQSMAKFRSGKADILVATDVASRGIDVPRVELVLNYDVPNQELAYFHRIGRTARAGAEGRAITFVSYSSVGDWGIIKKQIKVPIRDLNVEMDIKVSIPDPLKRQVSSRRFGQGQSRGFGRGGRFGRGGERGRDRGFGGNRSSGRSDRGGFGRDSGRSDRGGSRDSGRSDRGGGFGRDSGRSDRGGGFSRDSGRSDRSGSRDSGRSDRGGFGRDSGRSDRGGGFSRDSGRSDRGGSRDSGRSDRGSFNRDSGRSDRSGSRDSGRSDRGGFSHDSKDGRKPRQGGRNSYGGRSRW